MFPHEGFARHNMPLATHRRRQIRAGADLPAVPTGESEAGETFERRYLLASGWL
jgi:hypothetical protein